MAVIKADAYGHGAVPVAKALSEQGLIKGFAVSLVEEGIELRNAGIKETVLIMGPSLKECNEILEYDLLPLVSNPGHLKQLAALGETRGTAVPIHLKVDTGMGRLGFAPDGKEIAALAETNGIHVTGLATHLACADTDDPGDLQCMTHRQIALFDQVAKEATARGIQEPILHGANSAGALRFPEANYSWVRPGLALFGGGPAAVIDDGVAMEGVMKLVSEVSQVRELAAGESVSYGASWRAKRSSKVAVLPLGYADGVPRALSNQGDVLIHGVRCPIVGAVCMDLTMVDVTHLGEQVAPHDAVILLGGQNEAMISVAEFAGRASLIEYEVTCGISKRVPRVYLNQ